MKPFVPLGHLTACALYLAAALPATSTDEPQRIDLNAGSDQP